MTERGQKKVSLLREVLEGIYKKYNRFELIAPDPLQFVYKYKNKPDMEVAGFLASALAYGRVQQIEKSVTDLLGRMGKGPFDFTVNFNSRNRKLLEGFKHRFNTADDIANLLKLLRGAIKKYGSIEGCFLAGYQKDDKDIVQSLSNFCSRLLSGYTDKSGGAVPKGLMYLLSDPARGSACKRLNMYLRWMVRDDDVDAGLWKSIDKAKLIVPIDTHMERLCKILGLYNRKTVSMKAAREITESFAEIESDDPVKYDFALSRIGIIEDCTGKYRPQCKQCELFKNYCSNK